MAPTATLHDRIPMDDPRPLKRPRKTARDIQPAPENAASPFLEHRPVNHIFITDGLNKKQPFKKPALSCAECRRLKLKCDRVFPCNSCKKRGCQDICPSGVLVSGKGTRFILANTEQLHGKISQMSERIRQLEEAVEALQSAHSTERHPLLKSDLLEIKSTMGLYGGAQTGLRSSPPSAPHSEDGHEPESSMQMQVEEPERSSSEESMAIVVDQHKNVHQHDHLPSEIMQLSLQFPVGGTVSPEPNPSMRQRIRNMLPSREEASHLWEQARQNALWQYNPHSNETFMPNLLHHVYTSPMEDLCPRRLALLLMILAVGCLVDLNQPPDSPDAERYHNLARASLSEIPVMEETTVDAILVLFYMTWYLLVFSDKKKAAGYAWGLMGLTANLAQSIGLHRDGVKSKVIPEEVEKRRSVWWELCYLDARLSLSLGRPPSLCLNHMDCKRPSYIPDEGCDPSESLHHYQEWKHSCFVHCLSPVLEVISSPALEYTTVIELDKKIRNFPIPSVFLKGGARPRPLAMQKASLSTALEAVLLQLHRTFFTRALSGPEEAFNRRHKYAPSVVAVFLSASRMIAAVEALYRHEPALSSRILWFWSNAFSAAVALCLLVSRAPFTCLSPAALLELERARALFNAAKDRCPRAMQVIPILETMVEKANHIYTRWSLGQDGGSFVLRHTYDSSNPKEGGSDSQRVQSGNNGFKPERPSDSFAQAHPSLSQAIAEVHQRAAILFPMRKPCSCSVDASDDCPPSHSWSPPPEIQQPSPVLPDLHAGQFTYSLSLNTAISAQTSTISPASRMAVVDTLNFDFGALNPSWNDHSWMAWF